MWRKCISVLFLFYLCAPLSPLKLQLNAPRVGPSWFFAPGSGDEHITRRCGARSLSVPLGGNMALNKCSRCHSLRMTYSYRRSEDEYTVARMRKKDERLIGLGEADYIAAFLASELGER